MHSRAFQFFRSQAFGSRTPEMPKTDWGTFHRQLRLSLVEGQSAEQPSRRTFLRIPVQDKNNGPTGETLQSRAKVAQPALVGCDDGTDGGGDGEGGGDGGGGGGEPSGGDDDGEPPSSATVSSSGLPWWRISLIAAVVAMAFLLTLWPFFLPWSWAALPACFAAGILTFLIAQTLNPDYWERRLAWLVAVSWVAANVSAGWTIDVDLGRFGRFYLERGEVPWSFNVVMPIMVLGLAWLHHRKGGPAGLTLLRRKR